MRKIKLTWMEGALFVLPLIVLGGLWLQSLQREKLNSALHKLAGPIAKDCSYSTMPLSETKWKAMRDCAADSFQAKQPFWMREDFDVDGKGADRGLALGNDGNYYQVKQTRLFLFSPYRIEILRCEGTRIIANPQTGSRYIWSRRRIRIPNTPQEPAVR